MGSELEIKLHLDDEAQLLQVLAWEKLPALRQGEPYTLEMETTYYDTVLRDFSSRTWTVRRRLENGCSVICVKTPREDPTSLLRGEWEVEAPSLPEGLPQLVERGAPAELPALAAHGLIETCGARFVRRAQLLRLSGQTLCELAADAGVLLRGDRCAPFFEVELELKQGDGAELFVFGQELASRFGLHPESKSKFSRARAL